MNGLDGKVAVITGGASGIGEGTARLFVERGASVVIADLDDASGTALAEELGDAAAFTHTDVSDEAHVAATVDRAVAQFGRLDCMFNNAARVGSWAPIDELPVEEWDAIQATLLRGVFLGMKHAARVMKPQGSGSIVSTSSIAALRSGFGPHAYGAAKAGILQLTRSAAAELAAHRIRVNAVVPGGVATRINGHALGLTGDALEASVARLRKGLANFQPYPRAGEPRDLAQAVAFLAGDESEFITGTELRVDGGLIAGQPMMLPSR